MSNITEILLVQVNKKTLGIKLREVREVIPYIKYFHVPMVPQHYLGLINVRGEIWMLLDLKNIMFKKPSNIDPIKNRIIITKYDDKKASFLVDKVEDILELTVGEINNIKKEGKGKDCFIGEIYFKKKIIPIINLKELINKDHDELEEIDFNYFIE